MLVEEQIETKWLQLPPWATAAWKKTVRWLMDDGLMTVCWFNEKKNRQRRKGRITNNYSTTRIERLLRVYSLFVLYCYENRGEDILSYCTPLSCLFLIWQQSSDLDRIFIHPTICTVHAPTCCDVLHTGWHPASRTMMTYDDKNTYYPLLRTIRSMHVQSIW
jgi:hypothetical protein